MKDTITNHSYRVDRVDGCGIREEDNGDLHGTVDTLQGIVELWADPVYECVSGRIIMPSCEFSMIINGRRYWRQHERHSERPYFELC